MSISFRNKGNFNKTEVFLKKSLGEDYRSILDKYGKLGVEALFANTPKDTGLTAASWYYTINRNEDGSLSLIWSNSNVKYDWCNIAIMIQYGHATRNGGWVEGYDYINPSLKPIFDKLADAAWREVVGS